MHALPIPRSHHSSTHAGFGVRIWLTALLGVALGSAFIGQACSTRGPLEVNGVESRTMSLAVGQELGIRLSTVGPGEYSSPPSLSGSAVQFLGDAYVGPNNPGGPTQLFRFKAVARGRTIVTFQHTARTWALSDTIVVF